MDALSLYERGTEWTASKVAGAADKLDTPTPCEEWDVRELLNHMLAVQEMFAGAARGQAAGPPQGAPPPLVGEDPVGQYEQSRQATLAAHREPDADNSVLPIAFADQLIHGWDLAKATGQDATMPPDLAEAAFAVVDGRLGDAARGAGKPFKEAVPVDGSASAQDRLIAYCGRQP